MKQWEQIAFAIFLSLFGWLLVQAHKNTSSTGSVAETYNNSVVPWYLTYNVAAGFTGDLTNTLQTSSGIAIPSLTTSNAAMSSNGTCDSCSAMTNPLVSI